MILSKSYHEIMEKIEVTDEMRTHILNNVSRQVSNTSHKVVTFPHLRKMASIAACTALLLIGGTMMKNAFYPSSTDPNPELAGSVYGMEECKSLAELTKKAGFNVKDISEADMPFKVMSTSYLWYWNEFAQIIYEGTDNSLTYRKTSGTDDISGDYNQYEQILDKVVNGVDITIKGNHDKYYLATWTTQDFSYSLSVDEGIDLETILNIIQNSME